MVEFAGPGTPLTEDGLGKFAELTNIGAVEMWAVLKVETSGFGFLSDKRPKILFERHYFHRLTGGRYDQSNPGISQLNPGGYGAEGAYQYTRLDEAIALDRTAALQSASWGLGQIMGENFKNADFDTVEDMVVAMALSENVQLAAMAQFIVYNHLAGSLSAHRWLAFAEGYNGEANAAAYAAELAQKFQQYSAGPLPDIGVRKVQIGLIYEAYDPGPVDGVFGDSTGAAIRRYQAAVGLPVTGEIDDALLASLYPPPP